MMWEPVPKLVERRGGEVQLRRRVRHDPLDGSRVTAVEVTDTEAARAASCRHGLHQQHADP